MMKLSPNRLITVIHLCIAWTPQEKMHESEAIKRITFELDSEPAKKSRTRLNGGESGVHGHAAAK